MSRFRLYSLLRLVVLLLVIVFGGAATVGPSAHAQFDDRGAEHVIQKDAPLDTSWADLDRLAGQIESTAGTEAFQQALAEHGLMPDGVDTLYSAYPAAPRENRIVGEINPRDTEIDVFYEDLFGDEAEEGVVQVRSHRMAYFLSFFRKQEGRWHPLPYWIIHRPGHFPAPPDPREEGCPGSVCFDFVEALERGQSLLALQRYGANAYRGYQEDEDLYVYQIRPDSADQLFHERVRHESEMKSKPSTEVRTRTRYRWALSATGRGPRHLVMKAERFDVQYEDKGDELRVAHDLQKSGAQWRVGTLSRPRSEGASPKPVRRPSETELAEIGMTVTDTSRQVRLNGSLRAFVNRLRQTGHPDSLTARLRRGGLVSRVGGEEHVSVRSPDSVHVDLFPVDLFGDELREAVVQARVRGEAYRLAFFEAVPGGWERLPGLVQVQSPHEGKTCSGGFCFSFAEARAEGKQLLSGTVERAGARASWVPIQVTAEGPVPLAHVSVSEGTRVDWAGQRDEAFPKYGLLRVPLRRADSVQVRTALPNDATGRGHRVRVAALNYAGPNAEKKRKTSSDWDAVWARGDRVGGTDEMVYPALEPIPWDIPRASVADRYSISQSELYGREWLLPEGGGAVEDLYHNGLGAYLRGVRRAIAHEAWRTLSGLVAPADRTPLTTDEQRAEFAVSLLNLNEDAETLQQVGVDSVSYGHWSVRGANTAHSDAMVDVYGTVALNNGTAAQMQLVLDIREQRVYLVSEAPRLQQFVGRLRQAVTDHDWDTLVSDLARFEQEGSSSEGTGIRERGAALMFGGAPAEAVTAVGKRDGQNCTQVYQQRSSTALLRAVQDVHVRSIEEAALHVSVTFQSGRCRVNGTVGLDKASGRFFVTPRRSAESAGVRTVLESPQPASRGKFGASAAGIGDVTGDGTGDVAVGAPDEDVGDHENAGRVYILDGQTGAVVDTVRSPNPERGGDFGISVAGLGDVNGDAVPDVVVGAPEEDVGEKERAGRAYVVGGADGEVISVLQSPTLESEGEFGVSLSSLEDVNGDGVSDVVVGAYGESVREKKHAGRAYVVSGTGETVHHTLQSPNPEAYGRFGGAVAGAGDVNGDGTADVVVGASGEAVQGTTERGGDPGRAYILGGADGMVLRTLQSPNPKSEDFGGGDFGAAVSGVGDVNGDDVPDVAVGAPGEAAAGKEEAGQVYVMSGTDGQVLHTIQSANPEANGRFGPDPEEEGYFGGALSRIGDANGDGVPDLLVGADDETADAEAGAGRAYVVGGATGTVIHTLKAPQPERGGKFGQSVSGMVGETESGTTTIVVGAYWEDAESEEDHSVTKAGRAYIMTIFPPETSSQ